jgi:uncharacterized membrane protein
VGRNKGKGIGIQIPHQQMPHQATQRELLIQASSSFSGPIPPPALLEKYNEIIPNGAERILAMAEKQSAHREYLEKRVVDGNVSNQTRGSYFGFTISLVAILGGVWLIAHGKSTEGLVAIITSLGGLVSVFFYSKYQQKKERTQKSEALLSRRNSR